MRLAAVLALAATLALSAVAHAQPGSAAAPARPPSAPPVTPPVAPPLPVPAKLIVGTHPIAPFIIKNPDGTWGGISMDLWDKVARKLGVTYDVHELEIKDLVESGKTGAVDVIVSMNISAEREQELDLTHAFYSTGLAIAIAPHGDGGVLGTLEQIFTARFAKLIALLIAVLAVIGTLMWIIERKRNASQFGGTAAHGIGAGLWWSAVTMTTVGYGDKTPVTVTGRLLGLVWMFTAIIIISSFTAAISSALTVSQLHSSINGPDDLPRARIGTVDPSAGAKYCQRRQLAYQKYADASAAVAALSRGEIEAVVYEAPILQYVARTEASGKVTVLGGTFDNHGYAFGLREGSPLREPVNRALLAVTATDDWSQILVRYLGTP